MKVDRRFVFDIIRKCREHGVLELRLGELYVKLEEQSSQSVKKDAIKPENLISEKVLDETSSEKLAELEAKLRQEREENRKSQLILDDASAFMKEYESGVLRVEDKQGIREDF